MRKIAISALCIAVAFTSCKETGRLPIVFDVEPVGKDTAYETTPEAPQQRVVLIEEFTGVACPPCFDAHIKLKAIQTQYGDRVAIVGIQPKGPIQADSIRATAKTGGVYTRKDNRTQDGTDIANSVYGGLSAIPQAGIDRSMVNGQLLATSNSWSTTVTNRLDETKTPAPAANVKVTSTFNETKRQAIITVRVAYTKPVDKAQLLTVALVEDDVIDAQENGTGFIQDYEHEHVLRDILTQPTGSTILANYATKQPGLVYERIFVYDINEAWNPAKCHVVAYVSNNAGADKEVVQAGHAHLK